MKILIDTNIFIPLEPGDLSQLEGNSGLAARLLRSAAEIGASVYLHPFQGHDLNRDGDAQRRELREVLFQKYLPIPEPPLPSSELLKIFSDPSHGSNDWVDCCLLASVERNAVTHLVTEDKRLRKRAALVGLASRCLSLEEALPLLQKHQILIPPTRPSVRALKAHSLNAEDPIFQSLRDSYSGFDQWLGKCASKHRQCYAIEIGKGQGYAGVAILDSQDCPDSNIGSSSLKICTFKISEEATGFKLGELLLKSIFEYAHTNGFRSCFIETFPQQAPLIHLLEQFGFFEFGTKTENSQELVMVKSFKPNMEEASSHSALDLHKKFGPYVFKWEECQVFLVPLEPRFHDALFPDLAPTGDFWDSETSYGNAMRKAYLCNAQTNSISPGDLLIFYRSRDLKSITTISVVEETLRSSDTAEMARFLGKRTVYPSDQIVEKCHGRGALGILFSHIPLKFPPISLKKLIQPGHLKSAPQSITKLNEITIKWLATKIQ